MNTGKDMDTRSQMSKMSRGTQMLKVESQCFESEMERLSNSKGTDFCKLEDDDEQSQDPVRVLEVEDGLELQIDQQSIKSGNSDFKRIASPTNEAAHGASH